MMGQQRIEAWEILNYREATVAAAQLNGEAMEFLELGSFESAVSVAQVALSLSTYALALKAGS